MSIEDRLDALEAQFASIQTQIDMLCLVDRDIQERLDKLEAQFKAMPAQIDEVGSCPIEIINRPPDNTLGMIQGLC